MNSLKWKATWKACSGLCHLCTMPRIYCGAKRCSKNCKDLAIMTRPWQLSRSQSLVFLQKVYRQSHAWETSACHPPLLRLYKVLFPGKLFFFFFSLTLRESINTRTSFELRKHKCYFLTFHWWGMAIQMLQSSEEEGSASAYQPAPITSLAASVLPACHEAKANDKSLFATRTKAMSKKSDQVLVTTASYRESWL